MDSRRVLGEMRQVGLSATELGPGGFLPTNAEALDPILEEHRLQLVGGFVPVTLYRPELLAEELAEAGRAADTLAGVGADTFVLGPATVLSGYDRPVELSDDDWGNLAVGLDHLEEICDDRGLVTALHPHWGMAVDRPHHIELILESTSVDLCLDTGHVALGGGDPLEVARMAGDRVAHVHLKDVDEFLAEEVRTGRRPFRQAVKDGLFKPLGQGFVDIAGLIRHLEETGYQGWYVIEQDVALDQAPSVGEGPIRSAAVSVEFLNALDPQPQSQLTADGRG